MYASHLHLIPALYISLFLAAAAAASSTSFFDNRPVFRRLFRLEAPLPPTRIPPPAISATLYPSLHPESAEAYGYHRYLTTVHDPARIERALRHSPWVVSAFAWEDDLTAWAPSSPGGAGGASSPINVTNDTSISSSASFSSSADQQSFFVPRRPRRARLVGLARAISDIGLVATVTEVVVDPDVRGLGLASTLVENLARRIASAGPHQIYDIGGVVAEEAHVLFRKCGFTRDREGSVIMVWSPEAERSQMERPLGDWEASDELRDALREHLDEIIPRADLE